MIKKIIYLLFLVTVPQYSNAGSPQQDGRFSIAGVENDKSVKDFLSILQNAVKSGDSFSVSKLVSYPLHVSTKDHSYLVADPEQFIRGYSKMFTPDVKAYLLCEKFSNLGATEDGILVANGVLYIGSIYTKSPPYISATNLQSRLEGDGWLLKVISINVTLASKRAPSCASLRS